MYQIWFILKKILEKLVTLTSFSAAHNLKRICSFNLLHFTDGTIIDKPLEPATRYFK